VELRAFAVCRRCYEAHPASLDCPYCAGIWPREGEVSGQTLPGFGAAPVRSRRVAETVANQAVPLSSRR